MKVRALRNLSYILGNTSRELTVIPEGTVLDTVTLASIPEFDRDAYVRYTRRLAKTSPNLRVEIVMWEGRVRWVDMGSDVESAEGRPVGTLPRRRANTVPSKSS